MSALVTSEGTLPLDTEALPVEGLPPVTGTVEEDPQLAVGVEALAHRVVDAVVDSAVRAGDQVGWLSWRRYDAVSPSVLRAGDLSVYDGDAGILWAGAQLAPELGRDDLSDLLPGVARRVIAGVGLVGVGLAGGGIAGGGLAGGGLLDGAAGAALALARAAWNGTTPAQVDPALPGPADVGRHTDHVSGLSGLLLARLSTGAPASAGDERTLEVVDALLAAGRPELVGRAFPGPDGSRALCGLAHGASGVVLALAHWLALEPRGPRADRARRVLAETLLWEAAWGDPVRGWPDLREVGTPYPGLSARDGTVPGRAAPGQPASGPEEAHGAPARGRSGELEDLAYPVLWCHGAAGVAAVRLELCRLLDLGADLGPDVGPAAVRAEAETGVALCGRYVLEEVALARERLALHGVDDPTLDVPGSAGLTVCHGLGGPLDVLATAAVQWQVPEHLEVARHAALTVAAQLGDDPACWPTGLRTRGGSGLFLGLAGTAMVLARLARPQANISARTSTVGSPSLFGVPR